MKSAVVDKYSREFTNFRVLFNRMKNFQLEYNWLITDMECYYRDKKYDEIFHSEYAFLTGEELTDIVYTGSIHWAFAVCSGFEKSILIDRILEYDFPYADGNPDFWKDDVGLQHPLAAVEIVPWDSAMLLFIGKSDVLVDKFMEVYPQSYNLAANNIYNNSTMSHIENIIREALINSNTV